MAAEDNQDKGLKIQSPEEQLKTLQSVVVLADYIKGKYSPVSEKGQLRYYFVGASGTMLLTQADSITALNMSTIPNIELTDSIQMSDPAKKALCSFARVVGDIDCATTAANQEESGIGKEELALAEMPQEALTCIDQNKNPKSITLDLVQDYAAPGTVNHIWQIKISGNDYYVAGLDTMFARKFLQLFINYTNKPRKFDQDLVTLLEVAEVFCGREQLVEYTYSLLLAEEKSIQEKLGSFIPFGTDLFASGAPATTAERIGVFTTQTATYTNPSRDVIYFLNELKNWDVQHERIL